MLHMLHHPVFTWFKTLFSRGKRKCNQQNLLGTFLEVAYTVTRAISLQRKYNVGPAFCIWRYPNVAVGAAITSADPLWVIQQNYDFNNRPI